MSNFYGSETRMDCLGNCGQDGRTVSAVEIKPDAVVVSVLRALDKKLGMLLEQTAHLEARLDCVLTPRDVQKASSGCPMSDSNRPSPLACQITQQIEMVEIALLHIEGMLSRLEI